MLSGRVVDTNSAFLGRALADVGLRLSRIIKVGDSEMDIRAALRPARAGVVFVCGGLGPTPDDRTMAAVARELRLRLATDNELVEQMKARFRRRGKSMPGLARRQAQVPSGARLLENPAGMVPGVVVERGRRLAILLPGVPQEFRAVVTTGVVPFLIERYRPRPPETLNVRAFGVPESRVAERLAPVLRGLPRVQPAFYPSSTGVDVVLRAPAGADLSALRSRVLRVLGPAVYETGERTLAEVVGVLLREGRRTVAVAESCTGGLVGDWLTNVPGSSDWFLGGVVCYSNELKTLLCGVKAMTLERHGAVSAETAAEMARGVRQLAGSTHGVAVSGIAGPTGGTDAKPVGLVYVGVASAQRTAVERHVFDGDRRMVKEQSAMAALDLLRRGIETKAEGRRRKSEGRTRRKARGQWRVAT